MSAYEDLMQAVKEFSSTPRVFGYAIATDAYRKLRQEIAVRSPALGPLAHNAAPPIFGTPMVEDDELQDGVCYAFLSRDAWRTYMEWRSGPKHLRLRWQAVIDPELVMQADIRSLIDRS